MVNPAHIRKHMDVVSLNNQPLGIVDHVEGRDLKLSRDVEGRHHLVPLVWIDHIDDKIHLSRSAEEVERLWSGENVE